ncbi:2OG-Fe(II) oxygenase, partial [Pseudoalteromonas sp. SR45-5]|nr:2OG-Fe(II) oxygenase [Pseudoalteromonas sp. SR45-5]
MTDFIRVINNALSDEFCDEFISTFAQSPHVRQGVTSGGVDLKKKDSHDLHLNNHPEYAQQLKHIQQTTAQHVFKYVEEHIFMMIGAFGLKV